MNSIREALDIIKDIPEGKFCRLTFHNLTTNQCCVHGHIYRISNNIDFNVDRNFQSLREECNKHIYEKSTQFLDSLDLDIGYDIHGLAKINNHKIGPYQQDKIKDRLIAFMKDMIAAGYN